MTANIKKYACINPVGSMCTLSNSEVSRLQDSSHSGLYLLFRQCALAVLSGEHSGDNVKTLLNDYEHFKINIVQQQRGLQLELYNAPNNAFVNNRLIMGIRENLFSVVRDILYVANHRINISEKEEHSENITDLTFNILRHANAFIPSRKPQVVVCWGGHSIADAEYHYTKLVGYQLGLRYLDICTGCGPGAMKGPMKGAYIGHAKQRVKNGRFIGLTEPGIIAAESPNPIVNELVILPDIEKRLEAFVRLGHAIIVFPGGPGTCEEILYILGVLMHPDNKHLPVPLIFTGPISAVDYFKQIDQFIGDILGKEAQARYQIIIDNAVEVAEVVSKGLEQVIAFRQKYKDSYHFNWQLKIDMIFQDPFIPTHNNMAELEFNKEMPTYLLAANIRRLMSGIVAGNIKDEGINLIREGGSYQLSGDADIMIKMESLLNAFVKQSRMKLPGNAYTPCYTINVKK